MMLFWYRKPTEETADGYRILIPQAPVNGGKQEHELRFGTSPGASSTYLSYPASAQATKYYELQFGVATSPQARGMKTVIDHICLYEQYGSCKAEPNYGSGVAFAIDIPYPFAEQAARYETYTGEPYQQGYTVRDFKIHPRAIPRCNIFTFDVSDPRLGVVLQNKRDPSDRQLLQTGPLKSDLKLYLYSQPPHITPSMHHLDVFNKMLRYANHTELDLMVNTATKPTCTTLDKVHVPGGFTIDDLKQLAEINDNVDLCSSSAPGGSSGFNIFGMNPAECGQGPGC